MLKTVVNTAASILQQQASTSTEEKEEAADADNEEPAKKKFKDDAETEVRRHVDPETTGLFDCVQVETSVTTPRVRPPKKRKACISFGYCGK